MTSEGLEMREHYDRHDPYQDSVDAQHGIHTIHTSISTLDGIDLAMYCGPKKEMEPPLTHVSKYKDREVALVLTLQRIGSTWQRVNCQTLNFTHYTMSKASKLQAYNMIYVKQQGL